MRKVLPRFFAYVALVTATLGAAQVFSQINSADNTSPQHAPKYPPGVPAAVANLRIETDGTATSAQVVFNMPSTTFDGTAQDSNEHCSYSIEVNGDLVRDNVEYWWCDEEAMTLTAANHGQMFTVTVWASNELGDGPKTTVAKYVGEDQAAPVSEFKMEITDAAFELSWAPTTGMHGGEYDPNSIKYTLYAYPGGTKVGTYGHTVSSATVPIDGDLLAGDYYFGLEMEYWDTEKWSSEVYPMAYTNHEIKNPYEAPFEFNVAENFALAKKMFNIYDANTNDGTATWYFDSTGAVIQYDSNDPKDDWLFTMPILLSADKIYSLSVNAKDNGYPERMEVFVGNAGSVEAMTVPVIPTTVLDAGKVVTLDGTFQVPADGVYFIGFHACSDADQFSLTVNRFGVGIEASLSAPAAVGSLSASAYYFNGAPEARIGCTAPTTALNGKPLESIDKVVVERDGVVVKEFDRVAPGEVVDYIDGCGLGTFTYSVYAVADDEAGVRTEAQVQVSEVYGDDFTYGFTDMEEARKLFSVINANGDDQTWSFIYGGPKIEYNRDGTTAMDDWLFSMPMLLKGGKVYTFTVNASNGGGYPERLALYVGADPSIGAMTTVVVEPTVYDGAKEFSGTFACHTDMIAYLGFHGCSDADQNYIQVKNMKVEPTGECEVYDVNHNLVAKELSIPANIAAGNPVDVTLTVVNNGRESMGAYTARLYVNGRNVDETEGTALPSSASGTLTLTYASTIFDVGTLTVYAEIEAEGDEIEDDNKTAEYAVTLAAPTLPAVTDLEADASDAGVTLTWSAPSVDGSGYEVVTESFENYPAFSIGMPWSEVENDNLGDWTVYDGDGLNCYRLQTNCNAPNYNTNYCSPRAWMIMKASESGHTPGYMPDVEAATGEQNIICLGGVPADGKTCNDDWLISPMLPGKAQTITLKAKSYDPSNLETFEVLASTTGKEVAEFTKVGEVKNVPYKNGAYTDYSFYLPEGSTYFAIRCVSEDKYALVIDDITFERAGGSDNQLNILGYNVYRDAELITGEPVAEPKFVDNEVEEGRHEYHVNVVYDRGQSGLSNVAVVDVTNTGIDSVAYDDRGITVTEHNGSIIVAGADGCVVELYGVDGRRMDATIADPDAVFSVARGAYIVRAGNTVVKVIVH